MKITFSNKLNSDKGTILFICEKNRKIHSYIENINKKNNKFIDRAMKISKMEYEGKNIVDILVPQGSKADRIMLLGIDLKKIKTSLSIEKIGSFVTSELNNKKLEKVTIVCNFSEGFMGEEASLLYGAALNTYRFNKYFSDKKKMKINFVKEINLISENISKIKNKWAKLNAIKEGVFLTRDLVSEPANNLTPAILANTAAKLKKYGLKISVLDEKKLKALKMGALLGVAQGSANKPFVVAMEWLGNKKSSGIDYAFVGKGVTFDTGGISIKPSGGMEEMKYDMGGSAVVVGLMKSLALRKAKANIVGIIGLVENMPSGTAQRPGDVVKSMSGKTIEVINTDAEGRLVLADVVWYAQKKYRPKNLIDLATLTGAIIVSIGQEKAGLFSNSEKLVQQLENIGNRTGELVWNMPIDDSYEKDIASDIADMKNVGSGRGAGSTAGAIFVKRFIENTNWAHLDIAGVTWAKSDKPMIPKGGSGYGVRLLNELVFETSEGKK